MPERIAHSSIRLSIRRYLGLTILSFVAIIICLSLEDSFSSVASVAEELIELWPFWMRYSFCGLISASLWLLLSTLGGYRTSDLFSVTTLRYPPTWLLGILSIPIYFVAAFNVQESEWTNLLWRTHVESLFDFSVMLAFAFSASFLFEFFVRDQRKISYTTEPSKQRDFEELFDDDRLLAWVSEEEPILRPDDDLFGISVQAEKIASALRGQNLPSVAILGDYGVGKSSLRNLIQYFLQSPASTEENMSRSKTGQAVNGANVLTLTIGGWGLRESSVSEHIIKSAIARLSLEADCLAIMRLPAHYRTAMSTSESSIPGVIAGLFTPFVDASSVLKRLDEVATAAGLRLIIFLQDFDRNIVDSTFSIQLASVLDRLREAQSLSFVLETGQQTEHGDVISRICDETVVMPRLSRHQIVPLLTRFRKYRFEKEAIDDILPDSASKRDDRIGMHGKIDLAEILGSSRYRTIDFLALLLDSPRKLKKALRYTWVGWRELHGEIDFDDLFVTHSIRAAAPKAFGYLIEYERDLHRASSYLNRPNVDDNEKDSTRNQLNSNWAGASSGLPENADIVKRLIEFLYPGTEGDQSPDILAIQGIADSNVDNYWTRLNQGKINPNKLRDQHILKFIQEWKRDSSAKLHEDMTLPEAVLTSFEFSRKLEQFGNQLSDEDVYSLTSQLFELIRMGGGEKLLNEYGFGEEYPGFIELWRISLGRQTTSHPDWLFAELEKTLPISLRLANNIFYHWSYESESQVQTKSCDPDLRIKFVQLARNAYDGHPDTLAKAIDPTYVYSLNHLVLNYFGSAKFRGSTFENEDWTWLGDTLWEAYQQQQNQMIIIPQIAALLSQTIHQERTVKLLFDDAASEGIFKNRHHLEKMLATKFDISKFAQPVQEIVEFGRKAAENSAEFQAEQLKVRTAMRTNQ